jgi:hypothetical protein
MEQSPSQEADMSLASQEIPPYFVEHGGLLPHSQAPSNCPYPEADGSKPRKIQYNSLHKIVTACFTSQN